MTDIRVVDLLGPICVDSEDGAKLGGKVQEALDSNETVCLDFHGITTLAGAFLNTAVGRLYAAFGKDDLDRRLLWKGLDPTDEAMMRIVQQNALRFFSANQRQREALFASSARVMGE